MASEKVRGRSFSFAKGLRTLDPFEGYQLVGEHKGIPVVINGNAVKSSTEFFVVTDELANGIDNKAYVEDAKAKGATIIGETAFWNMLDIHPAPEGVADHWVVVDNHMESKQRVWESRLRKAAENGDLDERARDVVGEIGTWARSNAMTENKPAWDGSVAPYALFIQHGSVKSTSLGGWNIIACGFLSGDEQFGDNVGSIAANALSKKAVPWAEWRNDIGKVVVSDRYTPSSCACLFDGLPRCAEYDILGLDTSRATSMRAMFRGNASIDSFMATGRFDTSSVIDMSSMFFGCISARVINCMGWDISSVTSMESMFENSPAAVLFDDANVPIPNRIKQGRIFDTAPKAGPWLQRV